jgi:hypothetical protein
MPWDTTSPHENLLALLPGMGNLPALSVNEKQAACFGGRLRPR